MPGKDSLEKSNWLFSGEANFAIGATRIDQIPPSNLPEVAFCGVSNVGKSSLINALTGRKTLAKTSSNPGHTRQLNFFNLRNKLFLVDLPGYGYARVSKQEIMGWTNLIFDYLKGRPNLKRVFLLMDSRRGVKESDIKTMNFMDEVAVPYQIILTKCDKSKKNDVDKIISDIKQLSLKHTAMHPDVILTSSESKVGIDFLRKECSLFISDLT